MGDREFDIPGTEPAVSYRLLTAAVQPRPIAWVSTISDTEVPNLAPFSFFNIASRNPATLMISISTAEGGGVKDTLDNIRGSLEFVVNVPSDEHALAVQRSGDVLAPHVDEFQHSGLTAVPSTKVRVPRVAEAKIALECRLLREIELGTDTVVFGTVVWMSVRESIVDDTGHVDFDALSPLGRLAGPWFTSPLGRVPSEPRIAAEVRGG